MPECRTHNSCDRKATCFEPQQFLLKGTTIMTIASLTYQDINNASEYLQWAESNVESDLGENLGEESTAELLSDDDIPDNLWLGAVALFLTEDGFDGNAIVAQNQNNILMARAAGFTVGEIAQYAVLKECEAPD